MFTVLPHTSRLAPHTDVCVDSPWCKKCRLLRCWRDTHTGLLLCQHTPNYGQLLLRATSWILNLWQWRFPVNLSPPFKSFSIFPPAVQLQERLVFIHLCIFCLSRVRALREGQMRDRVPPECTGSTRPHSGGTCPGSSFSSFNCRGHSPLFQPVITVSETLIWRLMCHSRNTSSSSQPEPFSKKQKTEKKSNCRVHGSNTIVLFSKMLIS